MIRKNIRLRKEYLYAKSQELTHKSDQDKRIKLKNANDNDRKTPNELRKEVGKVSNDLELADNKTMHARSHIDDEYEDANYRDPKVFVTTSRNPSQRLISFQKEIKLIIPNATRVNRGGYVLKDLVKICQANNFTDLVIIHESRGEPDGLIVSHLPYGPTAYFGLSNVVLRHDLKDKVDPVSEAFPHLIFDNFSTKIGDRITQILKHLWPMPKVDSKRIVTYANRDDFISFRHHVYRKADHKSVETKELGPRFELKPYQICLGTVDQANAQKEWVLRPYMNTSKNKTHLS